MKKRIYWIDATKGLLILLMVLGHVSNIATTHKIDNSYLVKIMSFSSLYTCFFMQAFIILTGYTSNFDKKFKDYFQSLLKTILVPWLSFSIISQLCRGGGWFIEIDGQNFFFLIEDFWFLHVLFFGKLIYYFIYKYLKKDLLRAFVLIVFLCCGFVMLSPNIGGSYHHNNYLHYKDLFCMTFFMWFGNYCRRKSLFDKIGWKYLWMILGLYLLGHITRLFFRHYELNELLIAPVIISHGGNATTPLQISAYLFYTILGSLSCFGIMKSIQKCSLLEFFGRNSLIIYCTHFVFMDITLPILNSIIQPTSIINALLFIITAIITVIVLCSGFVFLTRYKPFNYLIGKF